MSNPRAMFDKSSQSPQEGGDDFWLHAKDRWLESAFGDASRPKSAVGAPPATPAAIPAVKPAALKIK